MRALCYAHTFWRQQREQVAGGGGGGGEGQALGAHAQSAPAPGVAQWRMSKRAVCARRPLAQSVDNWLQRCNIGPCASVSHRARDEETKVKTPFGFASRSLGNNNLSVSVSQSVSRREQSAGSYANTQHNTVASGRARVGRVGATTIAAHLGESRSDQADREKEKAAGTKQISSESNHY